MFDLKGKTALVTGGSQGIGKAIVDVYAEAGAHVFFCSLHDGQGQEVANEINARGGKATFIQADIGEKADVERFVGAALKETGRVDVLCNNASYTSGAQNDVVGAAEEEWLNNYRVGLLGMSLCSQASLPSMMENKCGSIIVISSIQGLVGCPGSAPYSTVKAGQLGFVKSVAYDYGKHNIRANAICPGPIQVAYSPKPGSDAYDWQVAKTLLKRVGQPREIAYAALYLAADESSFVTGTTIPVDGGWTAK